MDWTVIAEDLRNATIAVADEMSASIAGEQLYAICLLTDDDGGSVGLWAGTEAGYERKCAAEALIEDMTPDYAAYLRWAPEEWNDGPIAGDPLDTVSRSLFAEVVGGGGDPRHLDHLLKAMVDALAALRLEREEALAGVTLFVSVSDSEQTQAVEQRSAARLNPPELLPAYLAK